MNSTKVQTLGAMVVHTVHKGCRYQVHDTHEEHELGHADGRGLSGWVSEINGHQLWLRSIL